MDITGRRTLEEKEALSIGKGRNVKTLRQEEVLGMMRPRGTKAEEGLGKFHVSDEGGKEGGYHRLRGHRTSVEGGLYCPSLAGESVQKRRRRALALEAVGVARDGERWEEGDRNSISGEKGEAYIGFMARNEVSAATRGKKKKEIAVPWGALRGED